MADHQSQLDPKWYFGRLSRAEADGLLQATKAGTYFVRDSSTCPGGYVLCVSENNKVSHYIIHVTKGSLNYMIGDQTFSSLPQILEFYKLHFLDTTTLVEPYPRDGPAIQLPQPTCSHELPPLPLPNPNPPPLPPMGLGLVCKGLYNFQKTDDEDLAFSKGDILTIVRKVEDQWWMARNAAGEQGLVPATYIKPFTEAKSSNASRGGGDTTQLSCKDSARDNPYQSTSSQIRHAIVTQERIPNAYDPTQLKLEVGSIIKVLEQNASGTWKGEVNGKQGTFPFNRVRLLDQQTYDGLIQEQNQSNGGNA